MWRYRYPILFVIFSLAVLPLVFFSIGLLIGDWTGCTMQAANTSPECMLGNWNFSNALSILADLGPLGYISYLLLVPLLPVVLIVLFADLIVRHRKNWRAGQDAGGSGKPR